MSILASSPLSKVNNEEISLLSPTFSQLLAPLEAHLPHLSPLVSRSNRPLDFTFAHQVGALVYYTPKPLPRAKICCKPPTTMPWLAP
jgi:hypothetical protein